MSHHAQDTPVRRRVLDPELAALQVLIPALDIADPPSARAVERAVMAELAQDRTAGDVVIEDLMIPRADGSGLPVRLYRPARSARHALPALLFLHGGSFVLGGLETEQTRCAEYAASADCLVVSVDYRLAPEFPFPAAFDDGRLALGWLAGSAADLGVDPTRLAVGGLSAGGALAAGVAAHARDTDGPRILLQLLLFPVLDDAMSTPSVRHFVDTPILTTGVVTTMWQLYLPDRARAAAGDLLPYATPATLPSLAGLPPTFLCLAEYDPLRDEGLEFARGLLAADVAVDLRHHARTFHSFDSFRATRLAAAARRDQVEALRSAFMRTDA